MKRSSLLAGLLLASGAASAAPLPFRDGFEPPQTAFSSWTSTRRNGSNALSQSSARAFSDSQSLSFTYAGASASAQAAAVVDFSAAATTVYVRFFLFVPAGTAAAMSNGSTLRLVKLGDAASGAAGTGGAAKVNLLLRKDSTGPVHLRVDYVNTAATTTSLGTALTTPITEGTWHLVEFGYAPTTAPAGRVKVFVDDVGAASPPPRIDAAQSDMPLHSLLTAWVGLADAADAQSTPITLFMDEVSVAAAPAGTAFSTSQHFNELESGTLAVTQTPPGKAASAFTTGGTSVTAGAAPAAAHRGAYGLRITDADGQAGAGSGAGQTVRISPASGTVHRRFFWRPTGTNGLGDRILATLSSSALSNRAIAEVIVAGNGAVSLGGVDAASTYVTTTGSVTASSNVWHLVELLVTGVGTSSGTRKLYVDGTLAAQATGINWASVAVDTLLEGQAYSNNRAYQGTDDFDDLRVAARLMPSRLVVTAPAMTDGACSGEITIEARDSDGTARPVVEPTPVTLSVSSITGAFYSDAACTAVVTTAQLGVGTTSASVYFKPTSAGQASLLATNVDYLPTPAVSAVASLATQLGFTTAPPTVSAGACSGQQVLQARDAAGAAATVDSDTPVALSSSSTTIGFFADASCVNAVTSVTIPTGQSTARFFFKDTVAATPTVTLMAPGLGTGQQTLTVTAATASRLVVTTPPRSVVAGACSAVVTAQAQDTYGNAATVTAGTPVTFSSSGAASFFTNAGCGSAGNVATMAAGTGSVDIYFRDTRAGMPVLTAAAAGFLNGTQTETVTPAQATKLAFTSAPQTVTAGACSGATIVEAQDSFGNASPLAAPATVDLSSMPSTVTFFSQAGCMGMTSSVMMGTGDTSATFYFISSAAGPVQLGASATGLTADAQSETISASGPTKLTFVSLPQTRAAGSCSSNVLVQAQDSFGNPAAVVSDTVVSLSSSSATLRFSGSGTCGTNVTQVTIGAGTDTQVLYFKDTTAGMASLTVQAAGLSPATQNETITSAPPSRLAFATMPQTLVAGACSAVITAQARDGFGNPSAVVSSQLIALSTTSSAGRFFTNAMCSGTAVTQVTIPSGQSGVDLYYRDTRTGSPTLTLSNAGLSSPTQQQTVGPAAPSKLVFTSMPQTLTAGGCSALATLEARDAYDNVSPVMAATTVTLSSSSMTTTFHSDATCATEVTSVALGAGGSSASFYFGDRSAGMPTLSAAAGGLTAATQVAVFNAGPPVKLAFANPPRTVAAGACSAALTAQQQDATGNAVPFAAAASLAISTSSSTGALYSDPACTMVATQLSVPAGQSSADVYFKDAKAGPWGVTATTAGRTPASQTVTVTAGAPSVLRVLTAAQTLPADGCSGVVTVELYDALDNPVVGAAPSTVALSSSSATMQFFANAGCTGPITSATLPAQESQASFYFKDRKAGMPVLTMTVAGVPAAQQTETLQPGAPVKLAFASAPQTVSANTCSAAVTLEVQDGNGNASAPATATSINLSSTSLSTSFFSDPTCTSPLVTVDLAAAAASGRFYFKDLRVGTSTLTAMATPYGTAMQDEMVVTPGTPARLAFATLPQTLEAGACSGVVIVEVKDASGNSSAVSQAIDVTLTSVPPTATFHRDGTCGAAVTRVTVPAGAYQALFNFKDPVAHAVTLSASATGLTAATQPQTTTCPTATDGAFCDDADLCNGRETCVAGACTPGTAPSCDDSETCTNDRCEAALGCTHDYKPGCCLPPIVAPPLLGAAVGVRYRVGPGHRAALSRGTGPTHWAACDTPPAGFHVDATTGQVDWVPSAAGDTAICLEATAACGKDTVRFTVAVAATAPVKPVASFVLMPDTLAAGAPISVDASATTGAGPLAYEWTWGDGTPLGLGATAAHRFGLSGNYEVVLTAFDVTGQATEAAHRVAVTGPGCMTPPIARIASDVLTGEGTLTASLRCDCSPVPGAVYRWDFGDGSTAFGSEAQHTFAAGAYDVRLEVSAQGCASSDVTQVRVSSGGRQPPTCSLSVDPGAGPAPLRVAFAASFGSTAGQIASAEYRFSDGLSADAMAHDAQVARTLDAPGTLDATLIVTDDAGLQCRTQARAAATSVMGVSPPQIVSSPQAAAQCGTAWSYQPMAVGSAPIAWSAGKSAGGAGAPEGLTVDPATGAVSWTPSAKTRGPTRVTLVAQNEAGVAEQDFLVDVECAKGGCGCDSGAGTLVVLGLGIAIARRRRRAA